MGSRLGCSDAICQRLVTWHLSLDSHLDSGDGDDDVDDNDHQSLNALGVGSRHHLSVSGYLWWTIVTTWRQASAATFNILETSD